MERELRNSFGSTVHVNEEGKDSGADSDSVGNSQNSVGGEGLEDESLSVLADSGVEDQGKLTAFSIGINFDRFTRALELPRVRNTIQQLKERHSRSKVILGIDHLDMTKGIPQMILAFEKFLEKSRDWQDRVVLIQIAVPTRAKVPEEYQKLKCEVHEHIGRVNGRFSTLTSVPIHYMDKSVDFHTLCAIYATSDVALVTSLSDGMNLVSYEYVACQASKKGVLILSKFADAAQSLGAGAILVNPWNITEVAASIDRALNMPADEREERHRYNFMHVTTHTSQKWAKHFLSELNDTDVQAQLRRKQIPLPLPSCDVLQSFSKSNNQSLILDEDFVIVDEVDGDKSVPNEGERSFLAKLKKLVPIAKKTKQRLRVELFNSEIGPIIGMSIKLEVWLPFLDKFWDHFPEEEDKQAQIAKLSVEHWLELWKGFDGFAKEVGNKTSITKDIEQLGDELKALTEWKKKMHQAAALVIASQPARDSDQAGSPPNMSSPRNYIKDYWGSGKDNKDQ